MSCSAEVQCQIEQKIRTTTHGAFYDVSETIQTHPDVACAIIQVMTPGCCKKGTSSPISFAEILALIGTFLPMILSGGPVNWSAIIAAILALVEPTPPTK
jgi:hypothetical protein